MEKALTIIIPAYNVSPYINQEMETLLEEQSIIPYLDIIIVNDGSKDDTLEKASHYSRLYPGSVSVIDKENGGHGSGINIGLEVANGKYLKILDGDDWVNSEGLKELVDYILNIEDMPDAIINPFEKVWEDGKRQIIDFDGISVQTRVTYKEVNDRKYTLPLHTLTIRTGLYRENNIPAIDEKISYDDMEYILYPVPYIKSIIFLSKVIYEYRLGLSGQSMNPEQMKKKLPMHTKVIKSLAEYYRNNNEMFNDDQRQYYVREFVDTLGTNINLLISSDENYRTVKDFLLQYVDFPIKQTRKKNLKMIAKYGRCGYLIARLKAILKENS